MFIVKTFSEIKIDIVLLRLFHNVINFHMVPVKGKPILEWKTLNLFDIHQGNIIMNEKTGRVTLIDYQVFYSIVESDILSVIQHYPDIILLKTLVQEFSAEHRPVIHEYIATRLKLFGIEGFA